MIQFSKPFDAFEVHGCRRIAVPEDLQVPLFGCLEQCDDFEAELWSLYGHITGEGLHCIADFIGRDDAEAILKLVQLFASAEAV